MISPTLTALAQRELGPGHLVRVTDHPVTFSERVELIGHGPSIVTPEWQVIRVLGFASLTYGEMAASDLSICAQRRHVLEALVADRLAAAA